MNSTFAEAMFDSGILDSAGAALEARVAADGADAGALSTLGQIYRKQGALDRAAEAYARLRLLCPRDGIAAWMDAVLHDRALPPPPGALRPAPFVIIRNALPPDLHASLLPFVLATKPEDFAPSLVGMNTYRPEFRTSLCVEHADSLLAAFVDHVTPMFGALPERLALPPFEIVYVERRMRAYRDGHFFDVHADDKNEATRGRLVSYVYFFHREPRAYSGGDLILFDTDIDEQKPSMTSFTRIVPRDNMLLLFPSAYFHAVVPVRCASGDIADSRFVINGHIRRRE